MNKRSCEGCLKFLVLGLQIERRWIGMIIGKCACYLLLSTMVGHKRHTFAASQGWIASLYFVLDSGENFWDRPTLHFWSFGDAFMIQNRLVHLALASKEIYTTNVSLICHKSLLSLLHSLFSSISAEILLRLCLSKSRGPALSEMSRLKRKLLHGALVI